MNAVKLALALQYVRNRYTAPADVDGRYVHKASGWLVDPGTIVTYNTDTIDQQVMLTYPDGSVYVLSIEKRK